MKTVLFDYPLPDERIARRPAASRGAARMLVLGSEGHESRRVFDLVELIPRNSLVVLNTTRVLKARLTGVKHATGGRVEVLLLRSLEPGSWEAIGRSNRPLHAGQVLKFGGHLARLVEPMAHGTWLLRFESRCSVEELLEEIGELPLPPYLGRTPDSEDDDRYQTVFAKEPGSVAAPTAGLHLTPEMIEALRQRDVLFGELTLDIGLGTFSPVKVADLDEHPMHTETLSVGASLVNLVTRARQEGRQVVAIGTTVVRALEAAADPERRGHLRQFHGSTDLLIQPGYDFKVVDAMLTNFHMPRSTLLALVSAFAGYARVMAAYRAALDEGYDFLSYGDAMWIGERGC